MKQLKKSAPPFSTSGEEFWLVDAAFVSLPSRGLGFSWAFALVSEEVLVLTMKGLLKPLYYLMSLFWSP